MNGILSNTLFIALIFTAFSGLISGSYSTMGKFITAWEEENMWFVVLFLLGLLILPVATVVLLLSPDVLKIIPEIPILYLAILIFGVSLFSIGQLCFALAFKFIRMGINLVLIISIGTALTALAGLLQSPSLIFTRYGILQIAGILAFLIAAILSSLTSNSRNKNNSVPQEPGTTRKTSSVIMGIILSLTAGIVGSACKGSFYVLGNPAISEIAKPLGSVLSANLLSCTIIFVAAAVQTTIYFLYLMLKNKSLKNLSSGKTIIYYLYTLIIGVFYWFPIVLYGCFHYPRRRFLPRLLPDRYS